MAENRRRMDCGHIFKQTQHLMRKAEATHTLLRGKAANSARSESSLWPHCRHPTREIIDLTHQTCQMSTLSPICEFVFALRVLEARTTPRERKVRCRRAAGKPVVHGSCCEDRRANLQTADNADIRSKPSFWVSPSTVRACRYRCAQS